MGAEHPCISSAQIWPNGGLKQKNSELVSRLHSLNRSTFYEKSLESRIEVTAVGRDEAKKLPHVRS